MSTPISDCQVRDPRMRRTRQLLQSALGRLMRTKSFDEISVQDITDAATVNRATFYDHYTDKFALLEAKVGGEFHQLLQERGVSFDGSCPSAAGAIILAACDYLTLVHAGAACDRQNAFEPLMDAAIVTAIRRILIGGMAADDGTAPRLHGDMIATAASWAICGAAKQWFATPNRPSAPAIVPQVLSIIVPMLKGAAALQHTA